MAAVHEPAAAGAEVSIQVAAAAEPDRPGIYRCKNGLWDMAAPLVIAGQRLGHLFMGQVLFDDEPADEEAFRKQARRCGFDEKDYLAALARVVRWCERQDDIYLAMRAAGVPTMRGQGYTAKDVSFVATVLEMFGDDVMEAAILPADASLERKARP